MALLCLGSLLAHSAEPLRLRIHDDGTLTEEDQERLAAGLAAPDFVLRAEAPGDQDFLLTPIHALPLFASWRGVDLLGLFEKEREECKRRAASAASAMASRRRLRAPALRGGQPSRSPERGSLPLIACILNGFAGELAA